VKTMKTIQLIISIFFFSVLSLPFLEVQAQQPTPSDDEVNAIARQLYCPVCENTPLDVCPTQACHDWRELIRQMLLEGKTPEEIKQYFVDYYGARVLSEPPRTGINWLIYIVPPATFLAGISVLCLAFRNWKRVAKGSVTSPMSSQEGSPLRSGRKSVRESTEKEDDEYITHLEKELRERK
jgi:cytochrome c-type biogenesis protein CcmH